MLEVIAGIPFKNGVNALRCQQFLLFANTVANLSHCGVLRWRHLDLSYPHFLRPAALHHHHRHSLGEDAFPLGKAGPITVRNGGCITVLSLSSGLPMFKRV